MGNVISKRSSTSLKLNQTRHGLNKNYCYQIWPVSNRKQCIYKKKLPAMNSNLKMPLLKITKQLHKILITLQRYNKAIQFEKERDSQVANWLSRVCQRLM